MAMPLGRRWQRVLMRWTAAVLAARPDGRFASCRRACLSPFVGNATTSGKMAAASFAPGASAAVRAERFGTVARVGGVRFVDEIGFGFGWIAPEPRFMQRASHALASHGRVWVIDPVADERALGRARELGEPAGVVQ